MLARGPAFRAQPSPQLFDALRAEYGLKYAERANLKDLGGSSNLNLLLTNAADTNGSGVEDESLHSLALPGTLYVVRVYRPWVTGARLADIQLVRSLLASGGVPCAQPVHTRDGASWIVVDDRLVEVEPYVEHDAKMDSWYRLEMGLPLLGRIHTLLRPLRLSDAGRNALASNNIEPEAVNPGVHLGAQRIRQWDRASPVELELAEASEKLAHMVGLEQQELGVEGRVRQLVHGDFWDNNVLFRDGRVVLVTDFDFMGERARIDDMALTLYYANSTFSDDPISQVRIHKLRTLVDAYDFGLSERLTRAERLELPLALARVPLAFIAMIPSVDSQAGARRLAAEMIPDVAWALAIVHHLDQWQKAFVSIGDQA